MDKETLSNYGWITICVLVIAVMVALATPFGSYIKSAVENTTQGLYDTSAGAINSTELMHIAGQSFDDGNDSSGSYNHDDPALHPTGTIPEGGKYTRNATSTVLEAGANFLETVANNDTYKYGDYSYIYQTSSNGWKVQVKNKTKTTYEPILESINGEPVTNMEQTFQFCNTLTTAPEIPSSVTNMKSTFSKCTSLTTAPTIPNSVTNMESTFSYCDTLTTAPTIPSSVTNMSGAFSGCTSLTTAPDMSNASSVTSMAGTFISCSGLTTAPTIPSSVTDMTNTFYGCTALTGTISVPCHITLTSFNECPATVEKYHYEGCGH